MLGRTFTMSQLVALTGVAASTIRYYISTGLIPPGHPVGPNRALYDERHVESLRLVTLLKERRKLPVESIRKILPDLLELPGAGAFRPEMWDQLVEARSRASARTAPSARLLQAGVDAFTHRGYAEVRVEDVCRAADVAKGSFYRHFSSKEELYFAAAREVADLAGRRFLEATGAGGEAPSWPEPLSPEEALQPLVEAIEPSLPFLLDLMALAAQRRPGHGRVLREVFTALYRTLRDRLGPSAPPGWIEELLTRAMVSGMRRVVVSSLLDRELFPDESAL